jgi:hypothetical protein
MEYNNVNDGVANTTRIKAGIDVQIISNTFECVKLAFFVIVNELK